MVAEPPKMAWPVEVNEVCPAKSAVDALAKPPLAVKLVRSGQ